MAGLELLVGEGMEHQEVDLELAVEVGLLQLVQGHQIPVVQSRHTSAQCYHWPASMVVVKLAPLTVQAVEYLRQASQMDQHSNRVIQKRPCSHVAACLDSYSELYHRTVHSS